MSQFGRLLGIALLVCTGCKGSSSPTVTANDSEIVLGEYGSLTGSEANFGQSTHNGVLMALEEIKAQGGIHGKPVRLVHYDDQGKLSEVGTAVTRLVTRDRVLAIVGEVASSLSIAGGQIAEQHKVPMVSPSSTNPKVTETGAYIFRVCFIDPFQGYAMARFVTLPKSESGLGLKKIGILIDQRQSYSQGLARNFEESLLKLGGTVAGKESYQGGDQDFSAQLTNLKGQAPDAIYVPGYYTDVANIAKQARGLGITAPLLGGDGWESVQGIAGDSLNGSFYSNHYSPDEDRPVVKQFVEKYTKQYGRQPDSLAALGYDAIMLIRDALNRAWTGTTIPTRAQLRDALAGTKNFAAVTGQITIDERRNASKPAAILRLDDKAVHGVASISPPAKL